MACQRRFQDFLVSGLSTHLELWSFLGPRPAPSLIPTAKYASSRGLRLPCPCWTGPGLFAMVPKQGQMDATLQTMVDVAGRAGLDLQELLHQVHTDGGLGLKSAWRAVLPKTVQMRDARHVCENIRKCNCGTKDERSWVAAQVHFAATGRCWSARGKGSGSAGRVRAARPVGAARRVLATSLITDQEIVQGSQSARCGFTTNSISQAQESFWSSLKKAATDTVHMPVTRAVGDVLSAVQAMFGNREPAQPAVADVIPRFVNGEALYSARYLVQAEGEDNSSRQQVRVPAALAFLPYCPGNFCALEFQVAELGDVQKLYVFPLCQSDLQLTQAIANCLTAILRTEYHTSPSTVACFFRIFYFAWPS